MLTFLGKGNEYSVMNKTNKIPAHKLVFWERKISNPITKSFKMAINMMRTISQETLSRNGQDVVSLDRTGMNEFLGLILDLREEQEPTESFLAFLILRKQQLVTVSTS